MRKTTVMSVVLGSMALYALISGAAFAQTSAPEGACADLSLMVDAAGDTLTEEFADAGDVAQSNAVDECTAYIVRMESAGVSEPVGDPNVQTETETFSATDTLTETIEITQEAVVEGEVVVRMPTPDVEVEQAGAEVEVRQAAASVNVDQQAATIVIRQAPTAIRLNMPQPTITIDQPAPEIIVTMPRPGVSLENAQPEITVVMAAPTVTVTQGEPELDVQVDARLVDPGEAEELRAQGGGIVGRTEAADGETQANVTVSESEPVVRMIESDEEVAVNVNQAEPQIQYETSDPTVEVAYDGDPIIELRQVGEPTITFQQDDAALETDQPVQAAAAVEEPEVAAEGDETAAADEPEVAAEGEEAAVVEAPEAAPVTGEEAPMAERMDEESTNRMLGSMGEARDTDMMSAMATDLNGRDVVNGKGEDIGSVGRVVSNGGRMFLIVEHGGFLGIGDSEVALPIDRVAMMGEEVLLMGLSDEDLEAMPEYDVANETAVDEAQAFEIGNVRE